MLPVDDCLQHGHVLQVAVDGIKLVLGNCRITKCCDEVGAPLRLAIVIWHVDVSVDL